jgi:hypothetical protein
VEDEGQGEAADDNPEDNSLEEGPEADFADGGAGDSCSDQVQRGGETEAAENAERRSEMGEIRNVSIYEGGEAEKQNEPGPLDLAFGFFYGGGADGQRDDPEGAGELYGGADDEGDGAVFGRGTDDRAGVMNGERGPEAELFLRQMERGADGGEEQKRDGIQNENGAHRDGDFFVAGLDDRGDGGYGAASTDGGTGGDQKCGGFFDAEEAAEEQTENHGEGDAERGVDESAAAGFQDFVKIHAKAEGHHRSFEQEFGEFATIALVGMSEGEAEGQAENESDRRRKKSGGGADQADEKESFGVYFSEQKTPSVISGAQNSEAYETDGRIAALVRNGKCDSRAGAEPK